MTILFNSKYSNNLIRNLSLNKLFLPAYFNIIYNNTFFKLFKKIFSLNIPRLVIPLTIIILTSIARAGDPRL